MSDAPPPPHDGAAEGSEPSSTPPPPQAAGPAFEPGTVGCRTYTIAVGVLWGFAVVAWALGLWLLTAGSGWGTVLVFAGGPASAVFTVLGGSDLVIGWPIDATTWIVVGWIVTRLVERRGLPVGRVLAATVAAALVYGFVLSLLVRPA